MKTFISVNSCVINSITLLEKKKKKEHVPFFIQITILQIKESPLLITPVFFFPIFWKKEKTKLQLKVLRFIFEKQGRLLSSNNRTDLCFEEKKRQLVYWKIHKSTARVRHKWPETLPNNTVPSRSVQCIEFLLKTHGQVSGIESLVVGVRVEKNSGVSDDAFLHCGGHIGWSHPYV